MLATGFMAPLQQGQLARVCGSHFWLYFVCSALNFPFAELTLMLLSLFKVTYNLLCLRNSVSCLKNIFGRSKF